MSTLLRVFRNVIQRVGAGSSLEIRTAVTACAGVVCGVLMCCQVVGDVKSFDKSAARKKRTWADVQEETKKVFEGCLEQVKVIQDRRPLDALPISIRMSTGLLPDTSYQNLRVRRNTHPDFPESISILEIRIEREYSTDLAAASSFQLVPIRVENEGKQMYAAILAYMKEHKFEYAVIDPKSEHGKKLTERFDSR